MIKPRHRFFFSTLLFSLLFFFASGEGAFSQLKFYFNKIDPSGYPTIRCYIQVRVENKVRYDINESNFVVTENGEVMLPITLRCPDPDLIKPISVGLVVDQSGSMKDFNRMDNAKEALKSFIDLLTSYPSGDDEASVISFEKNVHIGQQFTSDKAKLKYTVDTLTPGGGTNIWDAVIDAVNLTKVRSNPFKAIILLTDGEHTIAFTATKAEAIAAAQAAGIPVYTIGLSLSRSGNARRDLTDLANQTGGLFFDAISPDQLEDIYLRIANLLSGEDRDCVLEYDTKCKDGTNRLVNITVNAFRDSASAQRSYTLPLDSATFKIISLRVPSSSVSGGQTFTVPVYLDTAIPDTLLKGFSFIIQHDPQKVRFIRPITTGSLSDGLSVNTTSVANGTSIVVTGVKQLPSQTGVLIFLEFEALDLPEDTTAIMSIGEFVFQQRCLKPIFAHGIVHIISRRVDFTLLCSHPTSIVWDPLKVDYVPNPFVVSVRVKNIGPRDISNIFATISYPSGFAIENNTPITVAISPSILTRNQEGTASWTLRAIPGMLGDTSRFCITISTDKTAPQQCCFNIPTPRVGPMLGLACESPDTIFFVGKNYQPDPFRIRLRVHNRGDLPAAPITVSLAQTILLSLKVGDRGFKKLLPSRLFSNDSGYVEFWLTPLITLKGGYDTLTMIVNAPDYGPLYCRRIVYVMPALRPDFETRCTLPPQLTYVEETNSYTPGEFDLVFKVKNIGTIKAEKVEARLAVYSNLTLVDGEKPMKIVNGGTLEVNEEATVIWRVRAILHPKNAIDSVLVLVNGTGGIGDAYASCISHINVEGVRRPAFLAQCSSPDAIQFMDSVYVPDPFDFVFNVENTGAATAQNIRAYLLLPPGMTLAPGESALKTTSTTTLGVRSIETFTWKITPIPRSTGDTVTICARVDSDNGTSVECCSKTYIPPVTTAAFALQCSGPDSIHVIIENNMYSPNPFPISVKIRNVGTRIAENVRATIVPVTGIQFSPSITQNISLPYLNPGEETTVSWVVTVLPRDQTELLRMQIIVEASKITRTTCEVPIFIPALIPPTLSIQCSTIDTIRFESKLGIFSPDPFTVQVKVQNTGTTFAQSLKAFISPSSGLQLAKNESPVKPILPDRLASGETGTATFLVSPIRKDVNEIRSVRCVVLGENTKQVECESNIFILAAPRTLLLSIDQEYLLGFDDRITIPINIDQTANKDILEYEIILTFDPTAVSLIDVLYVNTITRNWYTTRYQMLEPGKIRITANSSTAMTGEGAILNLVFLDIFKGGVNGLEIKKTPLHFDLAKVNKGDVFVTTIDGSLTTTGTCIRPLVAGTGFQLRQNIPNPFNPSTTISFTLPEETHVKLDVIDAMGRVVRLLAEKDFSKGTHTLSFNAGLLPSGMYFYRLYTPRFSSIKKMLLAR